mmetsp:Transcript_30707/g.77631  ORF Transcript_30707/g.77631 Transcript_30707/m.77631 type:complete len:135 (+) Transcript_30707:95-499(+)
MFRKIGAALLLAGSVSGTVLRGQTETCPSSTVYCGMSKDAAGTMQFVESALPVPGECSNVMSKFLEDGQFKLCGPGKWSMSPMSCDKHEYKAVTIEHSKSAFTKSDCKVYATSDYYQISGHIGSAIFTCDATAR